MKIGFAAMETFRCPRWNELPTIPLYMDQVMIVLKDALEPLYDEKDRAITPAMINNYVKQKLVSPPVSKKYGREHIAFFIILTILKKVLSMSEIAGLFSLITRDKPIEHAYDLFCDDFEASLHAACIPIDPAPSGDQPRRMQGAALTSLMGKLLLQDCLYEIEQERQAEIERARAEARAKRPETQKGKRDSASSKAEASPQ